MSFPKPQTLQIAISCLCLSIMTFNIALYLAFDHVGTIRWTFQMVNILMGIYGIVIIYQRQRAFLFFFFYALLFIIGLTLFCTFYFFNKGMRSVDERMALKLEQMQGTDSIYVIQREMRCCEEPDITENNLNSLTGSCCGKQNNEVCASIKDIFKNRCLSRMIEKEKTLLYSRMGLEICQALLLFVTSILSILLIVSFKRQFDRSKEQRDEELQ